MIDQRNIHPVRPRTRFGAQHQQPAVKGVREQYWPGTLMALGIITVMTVVVFIGTRTFIAYGTLFRWFAFFAFVGNLLPYARSGLTWGMERLEWFLFNVFAVGPFVLSFSLVLNFLVHGKEEFYLVHGASGDRPAAYWAMHGELPAHEPLTFRDGDWDPPLEQQGNSARVLGIANGCLGYRVVTTWTRADLARP